MISIEGEINNHQIGQLVKPIGDKGLSRVCINNYIKKRPGNVSFLYLTQIKKIIEKPDTPQTMKSIPGKTEKSNSLKGPSTVKSLKKKSEFQMTKLDELTFMKKLDMGAYACLYLV